MSETTETAPPKLLAGCLTEGQMMAELKCGTRTLRRREADGLPVIVLGATRIYPIDKARAWIMSHLREHKAPRRGRPRKA